MGVPSHSTVSQIPIIGFVGGVGCGKSSLARWLGEQLPCLLINADSVGHEVLTLPVIQQKLLARFGPDVLAGESVDRSWLAKQVFGPSVTHQKNRSDLEAIVHPVMRERFVADMNAARAAGEVELILFDAAILLEVGWSDLCDAVVYVDVPFEDRLRRVYDSRGWTADDLRRRESSQWPLVRKRLAADVVIDNSRSLEQAGRELRQFLSIRFPANKRGSGTPHAIVQSPLESSQSFLN